MRPISIVTCLVYFSDALCTTYIQSKPLTTAIDSCHMSHDIVWLSDGGDLGNLFCQQSPTSDCFGQPDVQLHWYLTIMEGALSHVWIRAFKKPWPQIVILGDQCQFLARLIWPKNRSNLQYTSVGRRWCINGGNQPGKVINCLSHNDEPTNEETIIKI